VKQPNRESAYTKAGVNIDLANRLKSQLPHLLQRARRPEMLGQIGGFGGMFALRIKNYTKPVLVASVDGVGTKLKVAVMAGRHDTVGQDLVNHCVNDIVVQGAEPLFFLDYLATAELQEHVFLQIIKGLAKACAENKCALIGGETAQMPGFYAPGDYDLAGTIVGVVDQKNILDGPKSVRPGDVAIGIASSGLHTNGYSLARKIIFDQLNLKIDSYVPELQCTVGEELLKIHLSYGRLILDLLRVYNHTTECPPQKRVIKACAHITGGGFYDNIPRVLPPNCDVVIHKGSWDIPPIFTFLAQAGKISEQELYHVFNMGIGMIIFVENNQASPIMKVIRKRGFKAYIIGEVVKGRKQVLIA